MEAVNLIKYTVSDIMSLPEGERAELIDGRWYDMATPGATHQMIVASLTTDLTNYFREKGGDCRVLLSPFAVFLNDDDQNYLEPDVTVVCDKEKIDEKGCHGAPDLVIEVTSPSTKERDYGIKLFKYRTSGVKEYWIINPDTQTVNTHVFATENSEEEGNQVSFDEEIPCKLYPDLQLVLAKGL